MAIVYVKRLRMEIDLYNSQVPEPVLPEGFCWTRWDPRLVDRHALVKYRSFQSEIDARVFPCLGEYTGCRRLMHEISRQRRFLPQATWLISQEADGRGVSADCGTIQGLSQSRWLGAVQNVGVLPEHRGLGLGRALVLKALHGFRNARLRRVYLEVTAENLPAISLYRSIGFRLNRTLYKSVDAEPARMA